MQYNIYKLHSDSCAKCFINYTRTYMADVIHYYKKKFKNNIKHVTNILFKNSDIKYEVLIRGIEFESTGHLKLFLYEYRKNFNCLDNELPAYLRNKKKYYILKE